MRRVEVFRSSDRRSALHWKNANHQRFNSPLVIGNGLGVNNWLVYYIVPERKLSRAELLEHVVNRVQIILEDRLQSFARSADYQDLSRMLHYRNSDIPQWATEAKKAQSKIDKLFLTAFNLINQSGAAKELPTVQEIIKKLPLPDKKQSWVVVSDKCE